MLKIDKHSKALSKDEFQQKLGKLERRLSSLQIKAKEAGLPVVIFFDGWSAAGKSLLIGKALEVLDPRYFKVFAMEKVTEEQFLRPFLWSYAVKMPSAGQISIFDKSYYMSLLPNSKMIRGEADKASIYHDIKCFEDTQRDGGLLILKYFLHVDKDVQAKRFEDLLNNEDTSWRVTEKDMAQNIMYEKYFNIFSEIIEKDSTYKILNANDRHIAELEFHEDAVEKIEAALKEKNSKTTSEALEKIKVPDILSKADLSKTISDSKYSKELKQYQSQMNVQGLRMYRNRRSVAVVYEGWDASGKGGNIKRLTMEMDPRGYDVFPVAAPTKMELSHHYLWRFWQGLPKGGHLTVFDRSWYGRVLVERVEGLCSKEDWKRAYKEINDFELHLHRHGVVLFKFWLHVSREEQLARFEARMRDPAKNHKITDDDWRNRDKWPLYYEAVNEMLHRTSTDYAPWVVVESESKKFARIKVLGHVCKVMSDL